MGWNDILQLKGHFRCILLFNFFKGPGFLGSETICNNWQLFKNDEKRFSFHFVLEIFTFLWKASGQHLVFDILVDLNSKYNKNKLYDKSVCWFRYAQFWVFIWDWVWDHILCMIFQEKYFSCYILSTDQIWFWLPLLLEILANMCIVSVYCNYLLCSLWRHKSWN